MNTVTVRLIVLVSLVSVTFVAMGEFDSSVDTVNGVFFLEKWSMAGSKKVDAPNPISDFVGDKDWELILGKVPRKCQTHLAVETEKLQNVKYDAHQWMAHVSECNVCCGPILAGIFAAHVNNVSNLPHVVAFFDYDSAELTSSNRDRIRKFIENNRKQNRRFLMIARASRTISTNNSLDYLRDHSSYNFLLSEKRALAVRQFIHSLLFDKISGPNELYDKLPIRMFGLGDPQIELEYVNQYNIEQSQWSRRYFKGEDLTGKYRLNQSVVIVAYDGDLREDYHVYAKPVEHPLVSITGAH